MGAFLTFSTAFPGRELKELIGLECPKDRKLFFLKNKLRCVRRYKDIVKLTKIQTY